VLGKYVAQQIGGAYKANEIDKVSQLIAHAVLGCATGAIATGDCKAGAVGGVAGEITADLLVRKWVKSTLEHYASLQDQPLTVDEAMALKTSLEADFEAFKAQGIHTARLASGLMAALVGGDVDTAADAGGNAAENNAMMAVEPNTYCINPGFLRSGCRPNAGSGRFKDLINDEKFDPLLGMALISLAIIILNEKAKDNASPADQENAQSDTNNAAGNPQPDNDDENNRNNNRPSNYDKMSTEDKRAVRSLQKQIREHYHKIEEFRNNPTVRPGMENQPADVIAKQQQSRIDHLYKEIRTFERNISKINSQY